MKVSMVLIPCLLLFLALHSTRAYPNLASKMNDKICEHMFPVGHEVDASSTAVPYELTVNNYTFVKNAEYTVTLKMKNSTDFEGLFLQARMANCMSDNPVGSFSIMPGDEDFLEAVDCHDHRPKSAVAHKAEKHRSTVSVKWTAPDSQPGRIYFRATVANKKLIFWTNVFSPYMDDASDQSKPPKEYCPVRSEYASSASSVSAATSLLLAVLFIGLLY